MTIRDTLQKYSTQSAIVISVLIGLCLVVIIRQLSGSRRPSAALLNQAFYSDDDGKTYFADDRSNTPPFNHGGKQACRAMVFRCPGSKPFVAYLAKYSDAQKAQIDSEIARDPQSAEHWLAMPMQDLKKPGESKWFTETTPSMEGRPTVVCPDGSNNAIEIRPSDVAASD